MKWMALATQQKCRKYHFWALFYARQSHQTRQWPPRHVFWCLKLWTCKSRCFPGWFAPFRKKLVNSDWKSQHDYICFLSTALSSLLVSGQANEWFWSWTMERWSRQVLALLLVKDFMIRLQCAKIQLLKQWHSCTKVYRQTVFACYNRRVSNDAWSWCTLKKLNTGTVWDNQTFSIIKSNGGI